MGLHLKRILVSLISISMIVSMLPVAAFAAETAEVGGKLYVSKESALQEDGTYTIKMEAFSTGEFAMAKKDVVPLDIVLVMDQSAGMTADEVTTIQNKAKQFVNAAYEDGKKHNLKHRIAIAGFGEGAFEVPGTSGKQPPTGWNHTGIFTKDGTFKNLMAKEKGYPEYIVYSSSKTKRDLAPDHSYFIRNKKTGTDDDEVYIPLNYHEPTYNLSADKTPQNGKTYYGKVKGEYKKAVYVKNQIVTSYKEVVIDYAKINKKKTYYKNPDGSLKLNWFPQDTNGNNVKTGYMQNAGKIDNSKTYYIKDVKGWKEIRYTKGSKWNAVDGGRPYFEAGTNFTNKKGNITYEKYDLIPENNAKNYLYHLHSDIAIPAGETVYYEEKQSTGGVWKIEGTEIIVKEVYEQTPGNWTYYYENKDQTTAQKPVTDSDDIYIKTSDLYQFDETVTTNNGIVVNEYANAFMTVATDSGSGTYNPKAEENPVIAGCISKLTSVAKGRRTAKGMMLANEIFANNPIDKSSTDIEKYRQRVVVLFTHGAPGFTEYDAGEARRTVNEAYKLKQLYKAKVFTLGLMEPAKAGDTVQEQINHKTKEWLEHISSNYIDAFYDLAYTEPNLVKVPADIITSPEYVAKYKQRFNGVTYDRTEGKTQKWHAYFSEKLKGGQEAVAKHVIVPGETNTTVNNKNEYQRRFFEIVKKPGTKVDEAKAVYSYAGSDMSVLNQTLFNTILENDAVVSHPLYADGTSIFRDIIKEEFRVTEKSTVLVEYVPGTVNTNDTSVEVVPENILWGTPIKQLSLDCATEDHKSSNDGVTVTIELHKHGEHSQGDSYKNMDIVDVKGFDYGKHYIGFNKDKTKKSGYKIRVYITGIEAQPTVDVNGGKINTNHPDSGVWEPGSHGPDIKLPVPDVKGSVSEHTFVQDYAKPMHIGIDKAELTYVKHVKMADTGIEKVPSPTPDTNAKAVTNTEPYLADGKYGNLEYDGNTTLIHTPKNMNWDGYDTFFVFGKGKETEPNYGTANPDENPNDNMLSKINVVPANNVYYEDSFVTNDQGTVGILYGTGGSGSWTVETSGNSTAPESVTNPELEGSHGWTTDLSLQNKDTDGTVHRGTVENKLGSMATATFTFTGTGVDVYSRTSDTSGTILASMVSEDGKIFSGQLIDTMSASGTYYQVPTLSFTHQQDGTPLPYGKYTVTIYVTAAAAGRMNYYLDGIRVYNPVKNMDSIYHDTEKNAIFTEVRKNLIDNKSFGDTANGEKSLFGVFIDILMGADGKPIIGADTNEVIGAGSFEDMGPKNEVYLKPGQQISFKVDNSSGNSYQIGLKSLKGKPVNVKFSENQSAKEINVNHSGDLYYRVSPDANGVINIINGTKDSTDAILAVTKLKATNSKVVISEASIFKKIKNEELMKSARAFRTMAFAPKPEKLDVKPDSGDNPVIPDIDIENPVLPENKPENKPEPNISLILDIIFDGFRGWF